MENCCNDHDICYDTCNKDKELCDLGKIELFILYHFNLILVDDIRPILFHF